ncbi:unnamed protein product [Amoebophrya sp. A120]|nr:unnamed protein product [Amoebophrya sp. A120]|eukprot:GSA120T00019882001.1
MASSSSNINYRTSATLPAVEFVAQIVGHCRADEVDFEGKTQDGTEDEPGTTTTSSGAAAANANSLNDAPEGRPNSPPPPEDLPEPRRCIGKSFLAPLQTAGRSASSSAPGSSSSTRNKDTAHTVYKIKVTDLSTAKQHFVYRRFREFRTLHEHMKVKYPNSNDNYPGNLFPSRRLFNIGNKDPQFLKKRQLELQLYLNGVLLLEPDCKTKCLANFLQCPHAPEVFDKTEAGRERRRSAMGDVVRAQDEEEGRRNKGSVSRGDGREKENEADGSAHDDHAGEQDEHLRHHPDVHGRARGPHQTESTGAKKPPLKILGQNTPIVLSDWDDPWSAPNGVLYKAQAKLIDLAQSPVTLDDQEVQHRTQRYGLALRTHIFEQPVDPIFFLKYLSTGNKLRVVSPATPAASSPPSSQILSEQTRTNSSGGSTSSKAKKKSVLCDDFHLEFFRKLAPSVDIVNPELLIVHFPKDEETELVVEKDGIGAA